ncbi:MAG: hypothetical protein RLZZ612_1067 [Pseudomonadota bacterium]|jgi:predicted ATPase
MAKQPTAARQNRISAVTIEGFRGLKKIEKLALPQLTVLIGANGSGKSTLIRFFEMLNWMLRAQNLQEFIVRQGGGDDQFFMGARNTAKIHAEINLETAAGYNDYRFDLVHLNAGDGVMVMNEAYRYSNKQFSTKAQWTELPDARREATLPTLEEPTAKTICSLLKGCATYQFHDTSINAPFRKRWDVEDFSRLRSDGGNLAAVLFGLREYSLAYYQMIVRQIKRVLPNFDDFVLEPAYGTIELRWRGTQSDKTFGAHLTSDGSLRLFCLITLLNMPLARLPDIMFFDEPELGLHPHAISLVAAMLKRVAEVKQVFIATQSPYMVDCFDLQNIILAKTSNGETTLQSLDTAEYRQWLDDDFMPSNVWLKDPIQGAA